MNTGAVITFPKTLSLISTGEHTCPPNEVSSSVNASTSSRSSSCMSANTIRILTASPSRISARAARIHGSGPSSGVRE